MATRCCPLRPGAKRAIRPARRRRRWALETAWDNRPMSDVRPVPVDDGAANHLAGLAVPSVRLPATTGEEVDLAKLARGLLVAYVYPRTGVPGQPLPAGWDEIPGARGCTSQSCAFRDHAADLAAHGAAVVGISAQPLEEQREFAERERIPYPLLSDPELGLATALGLPTFEADGTRLFRRVTFVARSGRIERVFYPIFPPEENAAAVLEWLAGNDAA
jgi:peroxiredoxin